MIPFVAASSETKLVDIHGKLRILRKDVIANDDRFRSDHVPFHVVKKLESSVKRKRTAFSRIPSHINRSVVQPVSLTYSQRY